MDLGESGGSRRFPRKLAGKTRDELMANLTSALAEALEMNRESARSAAGDEFEEVIIST